MTAQLSRIVYRIGSPENDQYHFTDQKDHADIAKNNGYEVDEYVLAGMNSEPVAWVARDDLTDKAIISTPAYRSLEDAEERTVFDLAPLYAAPPAPVTVPDVLEQLRSIVADHRALPRRKELISGQRYSYVLLEEVEAIVDNDCRAAMLKAGPVTAATVPAGWKLVPVEPTAEMISSGITAHYERSQIQIHDRPAPGPMECGYLAMLAASPAAPEQE